LYFSLLYVTVYFDFHYQFISVDNFQGQRVETLQGEETIRIKIVILDFSQAPKLSVKSKSLFIQKLDANTAHKSYLCITSCSHVLNFVSQDFNL
jgi:hypothetical protein